MRLDEFLQLVCHIFSPGHQGLAQERDIFVFQTLLLLRNFDLQRLRLGYVRPLPLLPQAPHVLVAGMPQKKTQEELAAPFAPLAQTLWKDYQGKLPIVAQQNRNERAKHMVKAVGLHRKFVRVCWVGGELRESAVPLWETVTTHPARHIGADLLLIGSQSNRDMVEAALGHTCFYGHDSIMRYGPQILEAGGRVLEEVTTVGSGQNCQWTLENSALAGEERAA